MINGHIVLWSKAVALIPHGWRLCDGTHGTPDLRGKFVIGAGGAYSPGDTGGAITHDHDFTSNGHSHKITLGTGLTAGADLDDDTSVDTDTGTTMTTSHLPPFHALCYIMRDV
ncbi:hypothetical protein ES703_26304 [subsurface metagenome]